VLSEDQNTERQIDGIDLDKAFTDKVSGNDVNRPQLKLMLEYVREGDLVISMDRLAPQLGGFEKNGEGAHRPLEVLL